MESAGDFRYENFPFEGKESIFAWLGLVKPVLGLGNALGRGLMPHSDKTQLAIGDPNGAYTRVSIARLSRSLTKARERMRRRRRSEQVEVARASTKISVDLNI